LNPERLTMESAATLSHEDYTVGWVCVLPLEMTAAKAMLDETHSNLSQPATDHNAYTLGKICGHNVVIVCLPAGVYGTTPAAVVVNMSCTFPRIQFRLMVGIGGGVPGNGADIRLWSASRLEAIVGWCNIMILGKFSVVNSR
jgi:nucleoside phosphorylase